MENSNNIEIKKLAFKLVLLFVFFVLLIITAVRWNFQQPVKSIKIEGTVVIPEEEISDLIKEQVIDTPKSNIKLSKLKEDLHSVPLMDEAYSSYRTTDEIVIAVFAGSSYTNGFNPIEFTFDGSTILYLI